MDSGPSMAHIAHAVKPVEGGKRPRLALVQTLHLNIKARIVLEMQQVPPVVN